MIINRPLGHLKISSGQIRDMVAYVEYCISQDHHAYCIPLNLTKFVVSKRDFKLRDVMNSANMIIADGLPIVWLSRRLGYKAVHRVTGIELAEMIISISKTTGWKLFFLGASAENLRKAVKKLDERFNHPNIIGCHHGYCESREIGGIIDKINCLSPDILFLGLGMPQKEYFISDYFDGIKARFCLPVGGAFDVWADKKKRTPQAIQRVGLEWLYRGIYDKTKFLNITKYGLVFLLDFFLSRK